MQQSRPRRARQALKECRESPTSVWYMLRHMERAVQPGRWRVFGRSSIVVCRSCSTRDKVLNTLWQAVEKTLGNSDIAAGRPCSDAEFVGLSSGSPAGHHQVMRVLCSKPGGDACLPEQFQQMRCRFCLRNCVKTKCQSLSSVSTITRNALGTKFHSPRAMPSRLGSAPPESMSPTEMA